MKPVTEFGLSIFFPVHNEIQNVEPLISAALELAPRLSDDPEIIIVNDGSTDGTGELCDELSRKHGILHVVHHPVNRGYGAALQSGFKAATKELVFYTDGDGQFEIGELMDILPLIENADVISCFRAHRQDPWYRLLNTRLFELSMYFWFGLKIKDPDCAFKVYRREVLERISMDSTGAMIDVEMLLKAQRSNFRIHQVGVKHLPRQWGVPSGGNIRVILRAIGETYQLWRRVGGRFFPKAW